ncbi:MAG: alpha-galactosidase [Ruminococcaceae bacterium]|nr:alpha-galactosidase [Oscillospiraceae bacterium]
MLCNHPLYYLSVNAAHNDDYHSRQTEAMTAEPIEVKDNTYTYRLAGYDADVRVNCQPFDGNTYECITSVHNTGSESIVLDRLSSGYVTGIGREGGAWHQKRFVLHICDSSWQGEGQWRRGYIEDFGVYPTYNHNTQRAYRIGSIGSWTTCRHYPMIMLEDTEKGEIWYFEIATSASWYIEVSVGGYRDDLWLDVLLSACHDRHDGWFYELQPGESYTAPLGIYGKVKGGFEEAVAALTAYKRARMLRAFPDGHVPVCFNDYMNCLWALPTKEKLVPLIDAAAKVGCEYFVIDAGWFGEDEDWSGGLGDYTQNDSLFGEGGFDGILAYIQSKGMKPGCWLEVESVMPGTKVLDKIENARLTRHGKVIGKTRCFFDFRNPEVQEHVFGIFERLYQKGIRFIKNDYNQNVGIGIDGALGMASPEELKRNQAAFLALIDRVCTAFPDLVIENCSSGCMRADHASEKHFYMQSVSDQEYYERMPSVVQGLVACMPPERVGIWGYPYPVPIDHRISFAPNAEFTAKFEDGHNTVFNMVQVMLGAIYLSGRIDCADEQNLALMAEAIDLYKQNRDLLVKCNPVYPTGLCRMADKGILSLGMHESESGTLLLAVWKNGEQTKAEIDLAKYVGKNAKIEAMYPARAKDTVALQGSVLHVTFPECDSAVWVKINAECKMQNAE